MPRVRTPRSPAVALGGDPGSLAGVGAAEMEGTGEADMITLGYNTDKNLVDRKVMVTHY
jgi:hypothetical protein